MNPLKLVPIITKVVEALRPFLFAIIGGMVVSAVNRCSQQKPVNLIVTNQQYEDKIQALEKNQKIISNSIIPIDSALLYLSKRYDRTK